VSEHLSQKKAHHKALASVRLREGKVTQTARAEEERLACKEKSRPRVSRLFAADVAEQADAQGSAPWARQKVMDVVDGGKPSVCRGSRGAPTKAGQLRCCGRPGPQGSRQSSPTFGNALSFQFQRIKGVQVGGKKRNPRNGHKKAYYQGTGCGLPRLLRVQGRNFAMSKRSSLSVRGGKGGGSASTVS